MCGHPGCDRRQAPLLHRKHDASLLKTLKNVLLFFRAVDPHSFFFGPVSICFLNAYPDLALKNFEKNYLINSLTKLSKIKKDCSKVKKHGAGPNLLNNVVKQVQLLSISFYF